MPVVREENVEERRASPRFFAPLYVHDTDGVYLECRGCLGISGFYYIAAREPEMGQAVLVKITLLEVGEAIEVQGKVVNIERLEQNTGVGVRFEELPFETERTIARWIDWQIRFDDTPVT